MNLYFKSIISFFEIFYSNEQINKIFEKISAKKVICYAIYESMDWMVRTICTYIQYPIDECMYYSYSIHVYH